MSSNSTSSSLDFSILNFNNPTVEENEGEHSFTKTYTFTVDDPNPPPPPAEEKQDPHHPHDILPLALSTLRLFKYTPPPEPLVKIVVRTIDRTLIGPGQFYLFMDEFSDDFLQFSMTLFNKNGKIKPSLYRHGSLERGTGVWGKEVNHGVLGYIEEIRVNPKYQRQGVGRWGIENVLNSNALVHCPFFFLWATVLNTRSPFAGPDPDFDSKKQAVVSFWRSVGFRRVAGTWFFGYARNPEHPMKSLRIDEDAVETQTNGFSPFDAHDASVITIYN